jgi:hypothetical protein
VTANVIAKYKKFLFFGWKAIFIIILNRFAVMFIFRYKKLCFLLLITAFSFSVKAQQTHFVYLQTDNGQPFYVKLNNNIISSSAEGYVILPEMTDGVHKITVGFPKKEHPEENFTFNIGNNNAGFLIKNFENKGLQLFNLETLALIDGAGNDSAKTLAASVKKDTDPFSQMLASVVKDSSILQNHQIQPAPKAAAEINSTTVDSKPDTATVVNKPDTAAEVNKAATAIVPVADSESMVKNNSVTKILSRGNESGLTMLYADTNSDQTDTVSVFIPSENISATEENKEIAENKNPDISSSTGEIQYTITPTVVKPKEDEKGFVFRKDTTASNDDLKTRPVQVFTIGPVKGEDSIDKKSEVSGEKNEAQNESRKESEDEKAPQGQLILLPKVVTSSKVNSDCKSFATNGDFLRLRKKMATEDTPEEMIKVAKKFFRNECFSTAQIKDLSYLFLTDKGRYMFFDAAYAHTSDSDQYQLLESQLTDEYYLNRFKAMIRK